MKKLLVVLVSLSLISNGSLYSMAEFKKSLKKTRRHWQCITKPKKNKCTLEERQKARKWLLKTSSIGIVSLLGPAGMVVTKASVAYLKKKARKELAEEEQKKGRLQG